MSRGQLSQRERERLQQQQLQQQRDQETRQLAQSGAQQAMSEGTYAAPGYWDVIGDADIERDGIDDEHLGTFLQTEMSRAFALGNIKYGDWESWQWQIENEFFTLKNEFKDTDCDLDEVEMAEMYGADRPTLTNERARRLRSAMQVKKMKSSLSVGARGLRSGTEIHAVARNEDESSATEEGRSRLEQAKQWLRGR